MRKSARHLSVICAVLLATACGGSNLSTAKAQRALDKWAERLHATVTVQGIKELPEENSAEADLAVNGVKWEQQFVGLQNYTGPAVATFSHYSDGRWVLTKVTLTNRFFASWKENIPAE